MKKRFVSSIIAAAMAISCTAAVMAEDKTPSVFVDSSEIYFDDQAPVILGEGTTLVPARGVFEAMGATVTWDGDARLVEVTSADNNTIVKLVIDDSTMRVYDMSGMFATLMMGQDFNAPETEVTLTVAPQIINDRTMIPLRAISEALNADVQWDGEAYRIDIATGNAPASTEGLPAFALSASAAQVEAGETVDVYVNVKNIPEGTFVSGVTATIEYNKDAFEFVEATLVNGDAVIEGAIGASNDEFADGMLKAAFVTIDSETAVTADAAVLKVTFKSINGEEGSFALSNGYNTKLGYNTSLLVDTAESNSAMYEGNDFFVDTTAVVVNGEDAEEAVEEDAEAAEGTEDATEAEATEATETENAEEAVVEEAEATDADDAEEATEATDSDDAEEAETTEEAVEEAVEEEK